MILVQYAAKADVALEKLDENVRNRIIRKIRFYAESRNPLHNAKKLTGQLEGKYRYRIGDHRAIFVFENKRIILLTVLTIKHRKDVYKN